MEVILKVQFVIIVLWKMKTEEQKSSFIINYKSDGNLKKKRKSYNAIPATVCKASVPNANELCP